MDMKTAIGGICSTCNNTPGCQFMKNGQRKEIHILYCEEFDDAVEPASSRSTDKKAVGWNRDENNFIGIIPLMGELKHIVRLHTEFDTRRTSC